MDSISSIDFAVGDNKIELQTRINKLQKSKCPQEATDFWLKNYWSIPIVTENETYKVFLFGQKLWIKRTVKAF